MQEKPNHWSEKFSIQIFNKFQLYLSQNKHFTGIKNECRKLINDWTVFVVVFLDK